MSPTFACTSPVSHITYHTSTHPPTTKHQRTRRTTRLFAARLGKSWFKSHDDNRIRMSSLPLPLLLKQSILALLFYFFSVILCLIKSSPIIIIIIKALESNKALTLSHAHIATPRVILFSASGPLMLTMVQKNMENLPHGKFDCELCWVEYSPPPTTIKCLLLLFIEITRPFQRQRKLTDHSSNPNHLSSPETISKAPSASQ